MFLRFIEFCCATIILGIFTYFLVVLHNHGLHIDTYIRAVEGISGAGVLYTIIAILLVCFLAGKVFFSAIAMLLDLAFAGAFAYIAYATRHGDSCSGYVRTPLGNGNLGTTNTVSKGNGGSTVLPSLHNACRLNTACFAVSIVAAVFFLISILVELGLIRHHKKEKAFGPSPNNGYTAGSPKRKFWQRKPKNRDAEFAAGGLAAEKHHPDALPTHTAPSAVRDSYATDTTAVGNEPAYSKYGPTHPISAQPQNTGTTGYQTTTTTHTPHHSGYANEIPGNDGGYTRTHQPYNANPSANY